MRDIKILINEDHSVEFDNDYAGLNQENLQGNITFSFKNFVDGQARAEVILDNDGEYEDGHILLDKVGQTYTMPIKSSLLNCKSIIMQLVIDLPGSFIITTDTHINTNKTYYQKLNDNYVVVEHPNQHDLPTYYEASVPVWKSETFTLKVGFSINATSTIPEDYPSWIEILNNLIEEVDQAVEEANNLDLDMTNENGVVIAEITKKDGSVKEVEVIDTNDYYTKEEIDNKGYINKDVDNLTNYTKTSDLSEVATSGSYNDLEDTPNLSVYSLITETGAKIDLEINSTTYVLTAKLYDKNNNLLSTSSSIDLPLETMVVGATYDSQTKEIVLTLKNGQTVRFSVADLVSGLQTEITPSNKLASDLVDDTNQTHKFVSQSEKTQITTNATNIAGIKNGTTINSFSGVESALNTKEDKSNKVTSISSDSTDTQYPSAKCVYDSQALQDNEISDLKSENEYLNSIINQLPKVSSQGTILTLNNTIEAKMNIELGTSELTQDGTPTPSNPSQVHTISGNNKVVVCNKNLMSLGTQQNGYVDAGTLLFQDGSGGIGTVATKSVGYYFKTSQLPNTITISDVNGNRMNVCYFNEIPTYQSQCLLRSASNDNPRTINIDKTYTYVHIQFSYNDENVSNKQVESGSTKTNFVTSTSQEANINLGDIEYCEIGDYKDEFVRDNEGNWGIRKNIGKVVLNGSENWSKTGDTNVSVFTTAISGRNTSLSSLSKSDYFKYQFANNVGSFYFGSASYDTCAFCMENTYTIETFKTWLGTHNVDVYFILATPSYTQITGTLATELENIYQYLLSYKEQTNISQVPNDLPFNISASALLDLNTLVGE